MVAALVSNGPLEFLIVTRRCAAGGGRVGRRKGFPRRSSWPRNSTGGPTAASSPSSR
jgi:hypothetical protein